MNSKELSAAEQKKFQEFLTKENKEKERKEGLEYLKDHLQWVKIVFIFNTICFIVCLPFVIYRIRKNEELGIFALLVAANFIFYVFIGLGFYLTKKGIKNLKKQKLKH